MPTVNSEVQFLPLIQVWHEDSKSLSFIRKAIQLRGLEMVVLEEPPEYSPESNHARLLVTSFKKLGSLSFNSQVTIVVLDCEPSIERAVEAMKHGIADYVPISSTVSQLASVISQWFGEEGNQSPSLQQSEISGESEAIRKVREVVRELSASEQHVLIEAPTGSESQLIASVIHQQSQRSSNTLRAVNCSIREKRALLAHLFGNRRNPSGIIESTTKGTLYLEQLPALTNYQQERLFSTLAVRDVRLIASISPQYTTLNSNFVSSFAEQVIYLPPLRERTEDIEPLAIAHLKKCTPRQMTLSREAVETLCRYPWPSNHRELENVIERAVLLTRGNTIFAEALAVTQNENTSVSVLQADANSSLEEYFVNFVTNNELHLSETEIAARLGISRKSLWQRRQRLGIPRRYPRQ